MSDEDRRAIDPHVATLLTGMGRIDANVTLLLDKAETNTTRIASLEKSREKFRGGSIVVGSGAGGVGIIAAAVAIWQEFIR